jgi:ATP-binding cassette subfamily B protein
VKENIVFDCRVDERDLFNVLEKVRLDELVKSLPHGVQTEIGERGIKLSGGEKQRLAFARIFFQNPEIIVLDEPTSALDSTTEDVITNNMLDLFENKTLIIIAHRLQTIRNVKRILVIEDGQIIEDGAFEQLLSANGKFKELWETQTRNGE